MSENELLESGWSERVSNDPKHRPQVLDRPSTTVRKEWCRRPQEAHLADGSKYRRLSVAEIARIQSFPSEWVEVNGITDNEKIAVLGNAVPPLLSVAIASTLKELVNFENKTLIEICAGIGGLSYGFSFLDPIAKIELWDIAATVLKTNKPWPSSCVVEGFAQDFDYKSYKGKVGLLCGGPPCQPWSQAGHQKGADDPRDVMGFTPKAIADCEPEAFLFENVPGLFTAKEHRAYVSDLLKRMGNPKDGLRYGVATVILNAADFGVPQTRRRVIILGIKNRSNTYVHGVLAKIQNKATHHDPTKPAVGKEPWVTLRKAFADIPVTEPWYKWKVTEETLRRLQLVNSDEMDDEILEADEVLDINTDLDLNESKQEDREAKMPLTIQPAAINNNVLSPSIIPRIEMVWPGKNDNLSFSGSSWKFSPKDSQTSRRSLLYKESIGCAGTTLGVAVEGDYVSALEAVMPFASSNAQMVYFDSPRLSVLETESTPGFAVSTWLSLVQQSAIRAYKSLKNTGIFVLHTDEEMSHYGRLVLDEVFGRKHHVTTFAWQKKYAPQNDKSKNNPTDAFDYVIVYSKCSIENLPKIGLLQTPNDIIDDGDWRGCYTAGHKGAKSGSEATKFHVNAPPYRWEILDSNLPKGRYWFDGITGVLWFESVNEVGQFWIKVRCSDSDGKNTESTISFTVKEASSFNDHYRLPERIWWLLKDDNDIITGGALSIVNEENPIAVVGEQYSLILKASGGKPYTMKSSAPGSNRYWEFALSTLVEAIATTNASFGSKGAALPSRKTYHDRENAQVRMAVMNWLPWQDFGKSEDASRHAKALLSNGITTGALNLTAKPQRLLEYLITLLAPKENDLVISLGDMNGVLACVAIKMHRKFIHITGSSAQDIEAWDNTAKLRIKAVLSGLDTGEIEKDDPMRESYDIPKGKVDILCVSRKELKNDKTTGAVFLTETVGENISDFYAGLLGAYKDSNLSNEYLGLFGKHVIVLDEEEILDTGLLSYLSTKYSNESITVVAERMEISPDTPTPKNVSVIHAPFDFLGR
jgi:DNA-cytosine methyltransferase